MRQSTDPACKSKLIADPLSTGLIRAFSTAERVNTHALVHLGIFNSGVVSGFARFRRHSSRCGWNRKDLFYCVPGAVPYQHHCRPTQRHIALTQARAPKSSAGLWGPDFTGSFDVRLTYPPIQQSTSHLAHRCDHRHVAARRVGHRVNHDSRAASAQCDSRSRRPDLLRPEV